MSNKIKKIIFFLKARIFRRYAFNLYNNLTLESKLSQSHREELTLKRLKSIIHHAYKNTDFYKWHYDNHNYNINTFQSLNDMKQHELQ